jgi:hypothetical protein
VQAHFDSGGDGGLLLPTAFAKDLPLKGELRTVGRLRTNFNEAEILGAEMEGEVALGPLKLANPRLAFAEIFRTPNFGRMCMQGHAFTLDQANRRMRISKPA